MLEQFSTSKFWGIISVTFCLLLSACAQAAYANTLHAGSCPLPSSERNDYRATPQPVLNQYYQNVFYSQSDNVIGGLTNLQTQQYYAISLLATLTERWSDSIDIPLILKGKNVRVRMTITYLSPELIQTVVLNHYLYTWDERFINADFNAEIMSKMEVVATRTEHLFFVTLTSTEYEQDLFNGSTLLVQLPPQSLTLTNSSNVNVTPLHDDHNLEKRIDLTYSSAHGYISYPMAVLVNGNCELLLNKSTNTHIVIDISNIEINGTEYKTRPWVIDYSSPLKVELGLDLEKNYLPVAIDINHFSPVDKPPLAIDPVDAEYWENLARFIWNEMTLDP